VQSLPNIHILLVIRGIGRLQTFVYGQLANFNGSKHVNKKQLFANNNTSDTSLCLYLTIEKNRGIT
jgi:hypothetical protein